MHRNVCLTVTLVFIGACAAQTPYDPLDEYEELEPATILDAPDAVPGSFAPADRGVVERGEYLVELLGCGVCHTDGALQGAPDMQRSLAGSRTGIAYANPLGNEFPGVTYPPNITPDEKTGIGAWTDEQILNAIRAGLGRHMDRRIKSMPWLAYAKLTDEDARAITTYLRSIKPIRHQVPADVEPGRRATEAFVYFGVYRSRQ